MKRMLIFLMLFWMAGCQTEPLTILTPTATAVATAVPPDTSTTPILEEIQSAEFQAQVDDFQTQIDSIDDFSREMINLMLDSHNRWQTLQGEVVGHWFGNNPETLQHMIFIQQPYLARIIGADYQASMGEDEEAQRRIDYGRQLLPATLDEIQPLTVYPHPLSSMGLGFAGDNIFPTGLAQRGGHFELVAEETILERATWVVDWYDTRNGDERRNRYWIDQETGLILKSWGYGLGEKSEEIEFLSLVFDEPLPDGTFQEGRMVNGRIITGYDDHDPIPGAKLQLEPGRVDDQGRSISATLREGGRTVFDSQTGGLRQMMHNHWAPVAADARVVTNTLTVNLSNLHRDVFLPLEWADHQEGETWPVDLPLEIGHAAARVQQIEWLTTLADGRARLRLTVNDDSPDGIRLNCLHLDTTDPWQGSCANFNGERTYIITATPGQPAILHLRASLELRAPFLLVLDVIRLDP